MTDNSLIGNRWIGALKRPDEIGKRHILWHLECSVVGSDELNANGKVINPIAVIKTGHSSVPRSPGHGDKLGKFACSIDQEMSGNFGRLYSRIVGMGSNVETAKKQVLDRIRPKFSGGKSDSVDHNRVYSTVNRSIIAMGGA
jgi:hypothetical protein